jgi:uncharacterized protein (DUF2249 family)
MTATLTQPTFELDLRTIPPRDRHRLIFGRFDALATGQALQLLTDHNPRPLRDPFDDRALGQFEWATLEAGPTLWRSQITRIADAVAPAARVKGGSCCSGGACCG